jgi:hypothetical protein
MTAGFGAVLRPCSNARMASGEIRQRGRREPREARFIADSSPERHIATTRSGWMRQILASSGGVRYAVRSGGMYGLPDDAQLIGVFADVLNPLSNFEEYPQFGGL